MYMQLLHKLSLGFFYGFVFVLPWQTLYFLREVFIDGEKWEYGTLAIYLSDFFLIAFLFLCTLSGIAVFLKEKISFRRAAKDYLARYKKTLFVTLGLILLLFSGTLWSHDPLLSAYGVVKIFLCLLLVFALRRGFFDMRIVLAVFTLSMVGQAFLGVFQFVTQGDFSSTLLGISQHNAHEGGISVVESVGHYGEGRFLRAYGGFPHPNVFGVVCAITAILSLGSAFVWRMSLPRRLLFFNASVILFAGLITSLSRNGFVVFVLGLLLLVFGYLFRDRSDTITDSRPFWYFLGMACMAYSLVFLIFFLSFGDLFLTRVAGETRLEQLSLTERTNQFGEARSVIADQFIFGTGLGTYTEALMISDQFARPVWQYQAVHNSYILALAEIGIVGFVLLSILLLFLMRFIYAWRKYLRESFLSTILFIVCFLFLVSALFDHWQWSSHFGVVFGALLLGLALSSLRTVTDSRL